MTAKLAKKIGCGKQKIKFFIVCEGLSRSNRIKSVEML